VGFYCHDTMLWKSPERQAGSPSDQIQEPRKVWKVPRDKDVLRLASHAVEEPFGWVVGLKIACGRERRKGIAGPPELLRRLPGSQLAAVPHHGRPGPAARRLCGEACDVLTSAFRERTANVDILADGVAVMNQVENHDERRSSLPHVRFFAG
jgi:hypothetical protein